MMKSLSNQEGFTLIEVIIATFILIVAVLSLVSVAVMVIKGNSLGKEMTTATTLAKSKLEAVTILGYGNVTAATETFDATGTAAGTFYTRTLVVNANTPAANMQTITVAVSWNWGALPRSVTISTVIAG